MGDGAVLWKTGAGGWRRVGHHQLGQGGGHNSSEEEKR